MFGLTYSGVQELYTLAGVLQQLGFPFCFNGVHSFGETGLLDMISCRKKDIIINPVSKVNRLVQLSMLLTNMRLKASFLAYTVKHDGS